jgi:hypothetical protein
MLVGILMGELSNPPRILAQLVFDALVDRQRKQKDRELFVPVSSSHSSISSSFPSISSSAPTTPADSSFASSSASPLLTFKSYDDDRLRSLLQSCIQAHFISFIVFRFLCFQYTIHAVFPFATLFFSRAAAVLLLVMSMVAIYEYTKVGGGVETTFGATLPAEVRRALLLQSNTSGNRSAPEELDTLTVLV